MPDLDVSETPRLLPRSTTATGVFNDFDRRSETRTIALHRASAIETDLHRGLCVIKNLSTQGAMVHTMLDVSVDDALVLVMASGTRVAGSVRWTRDRSVGIRFDVPTPLSVVLDRGGSAFGSGKSRRMPRLAIRVPVRVSDSRNVMLATTADISTHGTRLICPEPLAIGPVVIEFPNLAPVNAKVLWSLDGQSGCVFGRPFEIDELTKWIGTIE